MTDAAYPWSDGDLVKAAQLNAALRIIGRPAREAGVVPGTSSGVAASLRGLMATVQSGGGGNIVLEPGAYLLEERIPPVTGVHVWGQPDATVLLSAPGAGGVCIGNDNFAAMVGTDDFAGLAPHDFGFHHLICDGNAAYQSVSEGAEDFACPFQVYGYHYKAHDVTWRNAVGHGFRSEWGRYGDFPMQAEISWIGSARAADGSATTPRHGVWFNGPHDSVISHVFPLDCSAETDNAWCGIITGANGGAHWTRVHPWHSSGATRRMRAAFSSAGGSIVDDGQFEAARTLFESWGGDRIAGKFYASFGGAGAAMLDVRGSLVTLAAGTTLQNSQVTIGGVATTPDVYAIRLGRSGTPVSGFVMSPGLIGGFGTRGALDSAGSGGGNRIEATGYGNATPTGLNPLDIIELDFNTPTFRLSQRPLDPGPFASATAAKAASVPWGARYLNTDGTVRWVNV